jgi:hypothetical protein
MKFRLPVVCVLLIITACQNRSQHNNHNKGNPVNILNSSHCNKVTPKDSGLKLVYNFYCWYFHDVYKKKIFNFQLPEVLSDSSGHYKYDGKKLAQRLKETGFFSDSFIKREMDLIVKCNANTTKMTFGEESDFVAVNVPACSEIFNSDWIGEGGGDEIADFEITNEKTYKRDNIVNVQLFIEGHHPLCGYKIHLIKRKTRYFIDRIEDAC